MHVGQRCMQFNCVYYVKGKRYVQNMMLKDLRIKTTPGYRLIDTNLCNASNHAITVYRSEAVGYEVHINITSATRGVPPQLT